MNTQVDQEDQVGAIAVIGMAGRFPGSLTIDQLWKNLCNGVESVSFFAPDELDPSVDPSLLAKSNYVRARGIIDDAEMFDAAFFNINAREAELMDPQQRIMLELAWQALEHSGHVPESFNGSIGVFAGMGNNTYFANNVSSYPDKIGVLGSFQTMIANEKDFLTTRISYKFGLQGPSVNLYTACSTSLVAVCYGAESLLNYQCDMVLAGGISVAFPQKSGYEYEEGSIHSPDGHCRPFDARAHGTVFGNGGGLVVLRRLEDAVRDGDAIWAIMRGWAVNNDGADKASFMAPSVDGQAKAIAAAQSNGGVTPDSISYIETHGTGTLIGDGIEISALKKAFGNSIGRQFCALGSIKSNIGHLDAAAGIAGLIKTVLALKFRKIPATLHFKEPNPEIDFKNSPFYVNAVLSDWKQPGFPRRAGVSSFGIGGTNAHVVLEEYPQEEPEETGSKPQQIFIFSARTQDAFRSTVTRHVDFIKQSTQDISSETAYTLQVGRKAFDVRGYFVCRSLTGLGDALSRSDGSGLKTGIVKQRNAPISFMFPGQGSQYVGMGLNSYKSDKIFRETVDACCETLKPVIETDLRTILYPSQNNNKAAEEKLKETFLTQPALFIIEYALARLWMQWGVVPESMIGHSIGEYVAACIAGVFSLDDALHVVAMRARLMQDMPAGSMLSVRMSEATLKQKLSDGLSIAAVNAPKLCVVSGKKDKIESLQRRLTEEKVTVSLLKTSHAFHSAMMDPAASDLCKFMKTFKLSPPSIPFVSTVTGTWITARQAVDPGYWAGQLRSPVQFSEGIKTLLSNKQRVFLEVGPRMTCATLVRQHAESPESLKVFSSLADTSQDEAETSALLAAIGNLWVCGIDIDWKRHHGSQKTTRAALPTYPFEQKRFWLDSPVFGTGKEKPAGDPAGDCASESKPDRLEKAAGSHFAISSVRLVVKGSFHVLLYTVKPGCFVTITALRDYILMECPGVVLPRYFIEMEELPPLEAKSNGCVETEENPGDEKRENSDEPQTPGEKVLARIWRETLGVDSIRRQDNFFEQGGDSVLSMQAVAQIAQETGIKLTPRVILLNTLKQIAAQYFPDNRETETLQAKPAGIVPDAGNKTKKLIEDQIPFYFGDITAPLFALYHSPSIMQVRKTGVVICSPIGQEYIRTHWALRLLAGKLSKAGFPVLRFDYFGQGDSAGMTMQGGHSRWLQDIVVACRELRYWSGCREISLVGLRYGASLAALAACSYVNVNDLVLWDPVVRGRRYLEGLSGLHASKFGTKRTLLKKSTMTEMLGFPYPPQLQEEIIKVDLTSCDYKQANRVSIIVSQETQDISALAASLSSNDKQHGYRCIPDGGDWDDPEEFDQALLVNRILDEIVHVVARDAS